MKISDYAKAQGWLKRHASSENSAGEWQKYVALNTTPELDEAIKTIDDKFGPGTVFPASEAPIPEMTDTQRIMEFNQRNPYSDGQLVTPSVDGSRPGYNGDPYKRTTIYKKRQEAKKKGLIYDVKTKKFKPLKATAQDTEQSVKMINDWTKEWINKNSKNYGVREIDKFKKDLAKDWKKQLKVFEKNPKFKFPATVAERISLSTSEGLPYVKGLDIDKVTTPIKKDPTLAYEKIFYNKKLQNPEFKKKVTEYLDFVNLDKRYGNVRDKMAAEGKIATDPEGKGFFKKSSGSKAAYLEYAKFADDDVVYFFGDVLNSRKLWNNNPSSLNIYSILEQNIDPKKVKAYRKKFQTAYSSWMNNLKEVSDLAGYNFDTVLNAQYKEAEKMKKLFNVENLPFEFQYAQDHLFGLAEAKTLGDPKIARQTLNNIVAATKDQNRYLGTKGFTNRRIKLIKEFKAAPKNARGPIIEKLNTLSEEFVPGRLQYDVRKDGSLKITNLKPEKTFKARATAYGKITKTFPKNILNAFCGKGSRKNFATAGTVDGLTCSMEEIEGNIKKQTAEAQKLSKDGKIPKKFGKLRALGKFFGWVDAPIEFMFAAPHLIAGDIEGAKRATTAGLFGWGKINLDNIPDEKARQYLKHQKDMNDYMTNYGIALNAENKLQDSLAGLEDYEIDYQQQFDNALKNMEDIKKNYQEYGYTYKTGDTPIQGKVAAQQYIRDKVKSDFEKKIDRQGVTEFFKDSNQELLKENLRDLGGRPKKVTPITDLESYMRNKGEEMAGNTNIMFNVKPYVLEEAEALGVPGIFDDYALGAGVEGPGRKSLQDAYTEIPLEYANQLAALEKKQLKEGLLEKRLTGFAGGGIASIRRPNAIPPESGPTPQGLPSMYNRVKKI